MYQLKPDAIKRIVKEELATKHQYIMQKSGSVSTSDFINNSFYVAGRQLENSKTYEDLDKFLSEWYRVSLEEWVKSL